MRSTRAHSALSADVGTHASLACILAAALLALSCAGSPPKLSAIAEFLPREPDLPGWKQTEAPRRYDESNFVLLGDEQAAFMRSSSVTELARTSFASFSEPGRALSVDLYLCAEPIDAFGIAGRLRTGAGDGSAGIHCADESCRAEASLCFRKGRFCGLVRTSPEYRGAQEDMRMCAEAVCANIGAPGMPLPSFVDVFGDVSGRCDVVYYAEGIPEIPGLRRLCVRTRAAEKNGGSILYSKTESAQDALRVFTGCLAGGGEALILREAAARRLAQKRTPGGILMISIEGEWLFGVKDMPDERAAASLIEILRAELPAANDAHAR